MKQDTIYMWFSAKNIQKCQKDTFFFAESLELSELNCIFVV